MFKKILKGFGMGKNKKNKQGQKSKAPKKNSPTPSHFKNADKKNKILTKKSAAKKPLAPVIAKAKHPSPPKKLIPVKHLGKNKIHPQAKDKNLKKEQPQSKINLGAIKKEAIDKNLKLKVSGKEQKNQNQTTLKKEISEKLPVPLNKVKDEKRNKIETEVDNKNLKNNKKKVEVEKKILVKNNKNSKGNEKEKDDPNFDEAFDDFELGGDDSLDDADFDADLLLEEENKKNIKKKKIVDDEIREQLADEIINLSEEYGLTDVLGAIRSLDFFGSDNIDCREKACDNPTTSQGYCRFHYIKRWKEIKKKNQILTEGRLQKMIEELISKNPFKYVEAILNDLMDEKTFGTVLRELNIDMTSDEGFDDVGDDEMDEEDIAFETKITVKVAFDED